MPIERSGLGATRLGRWLARLASGAASRTDIETTNELLKRLEQIWSDHLRYAGP